MFIGEIAAIMTAMCWVGSSLSFEYAGKKVGSLVLNLMRLVISFVIISIINFFITGGFQNVNLTAESFWVLMMSGLIGFVLGDVFLFQAFIVIGARISMLIMALAPPLTAVLSYFLLGETLGIFEVLGMLVTVLGIAIVITGKSEKGKKLVVRHSVRGIFFAFMGAVGQALGLILSKMGVRDLNPFVATQVRILAGILGFILILSWFKKWDPFIKTFRLREVMTGITIGSLFGPVVGVSLSLMAVKYTSTAVASTLMALTPILIIPVSVFFLKERIKPNEILGAVVGVFGVALLFMG